MAETEQGAPRDNQEETIAFLSSPETYCIDGPVERIDTHVAMIFLAGEFAYKLKRAVRLPYLDFSTAPQRKAVCETELALNRRTAPEMYCKVRSIGHRMGAGLGFDTGEPVDWVLVMRRFPSEALLENVAGRGELTPNLVRKLADNIAGFHAKADVWPGGDGAARTRKVIEGNRSSMAALPQGALDAQLAGELYQRSISLLEEITRLLDRRARNGRVRHCHGDLHLENICLWHGEPTLFDCLEFDAELATTDVLYDLAFLLMDLWMGGYHNEACLLLNRYCDMTGEGEGLAALPLFLSMRAAVRAHVSASAADRQSDSAARQHKRDAAQAHLSTGNFFLQPCPARLVAVGGLSGTGKSTLAGSLAARIGRAPGARWLRSDVMRKRMAGVRPEDPLPAHAYTAEAADAVYATLAKEARTALAAGQAVIVDAVFAKPQERATMEALARSEGVAFAGLWLEASGETLSRRVMAREGDASDADATVVKRQLSYEVGDLGSWHRIDATGTPEEVAALAWKLLGDRS